MVNLTKTLCQNLDWEAEKRDINLFFRGVHSGILPIGGVRNLKMNELKLNRKPTETDLSAALDKSVEAAVAFRDFRNRFGFPALTTHAFQGMGQRCSTARRAAKKNV